MNEAFPIRQAVRAVACNDRHEILLMHWKDPLDGHEILEPPGGEVQIGESVAAAIVREVLEETGWPARLIGTPRLYHRETTWAGQPFEGDEWFCLALLEGVRSAPDLEAYERDWFKGMAWVPIDELVASHIQLEPPNLGEIVSDLLSRELELGSRPERGA